MKKKTSKNSASQPKPKGSEPMADIPESKSPFNLAAIKELMELMDKHGATSINLENGDEAWRIRRGPATVPAMPYLPQPMQYAPAPMAHAPAPTPVASTAAAPAPAAAAESNLPAIKSPTVGTFYGSPTPDDPPYVQVGSKVQPDTVVCIVEAMKVFNQITADVSGTIAEVLVKSGDSVEYGQPLFRIKS